MPVPILTPICADYVLLSTGWRVRSKASPHEAPQLLEQSRKLLGADAPGHHPLENAASGIVATLTGDSILTPMDTVKQRLQVNAIPSMTCRCN